MSKHTHSLSILFLAFAEWFNLSLFVLLSSNSPSAWTVYLGRETQSGPNVNEVSRTLSQIIVHPDYNNTLFNNDITLMKLSNPVTFTNFIRPICLASSSSQFYNSTSCWATGWGNLGKDGEYPLSFSSIIKSKLWLSDTLPKSGVVCTVAKMSYCIVRRSSLTWAASEH